VESTHAGRPHAALGRAERSNHDFAISAELRMAEDAGSFDFTLSAVELAAIGSLDRTAALARTR